MTDKAKFYKILGLLSRGEKQKLCDCSRGENTPVKRESPTASPDLSSLSPKQAEEDLRKLCHKESKKASL